MPPPQPTLGQANNVDADTLHKSEVAGRKLLALCTKIAPEDRHLSAPEELILDEYCASGSGTGRPALTRSFIQSLRLLLQARRYEIALVLFRKIETVVSPKFLEAEADILPLGTSSAFRKEWTIPDTLKEIIQLLIDHGADVRAKDD